MKINLSPQAINTIGGIILIIAVGFGSMKITEHFAVEEIKELKKEIKELKKELDDNELEKFKPSDKGTSEY